MPAQQLDPWRSPPQTALTQRRDNGQAKVRPSRRALLFAGAGAFGVAILGGTAIDRHRKSVPDRTRDAVPTPASTTTAPDAIPLTNELAPKYGRTAVAVLRAFEDREWVVAEDTRANLQVQLERHDETGAIFLRVGVVSLCESSVPTIDLQSLTLEVRGAVVRMNNPSATFHQLGAILFLQDLDMQLDIRHPETFRWTVDLRVEQRDGAFRDHWWQETDEYAFSPQELSSAPSAEPTASSVSLTGHRAGRHISGPLSLR